MDDRNQTPLQRRAFLGSMAVKAAYVAPAVLALKAARRSQAGFASCGDAGSPCAADADCCGGFTCQTSSGMPCNGMMNCDCQ